MEQYNKMEKQDKKDYFKYYKPIKNSTHTQSPKQRIQIERKRYQGHKLLPHIAQEYHFRITNHLLLKKIITPKRDKIIMQSLSNVGKKMNSSISHHSHFGHAEKFRTSKKFKSMHHIKNKQSDIVDTIKPRTAANSHHRIKRKVFINQSENVSQNQHIESIAEEVSREQEQLPQTISLVQTKSIKRTSPRQQKGKQNKQVELMHGKCFINPPSGYGSGSTIIKITHLSIDINPSIKPDTLIQLQLIERPSMMKQWRGIKEIVQQKTIKTSPFKYSELPSLEKDTQIKFKIHLHRIGHFVPLRIWRYTGVQSILVGTIDLPLVCFQNQNRESELKQGKQIRQSVFWQLKKTNPQKGRKIIHSQLDKHLVKIKMHQTNATVHIGYKLYPKKFKKIVRIGKQ